MALDKIPVFMTMSLERSLLRPLQSINGGKGTAQYRRALGPSVFAGPWAYVDHIVLPPGATIGSHTHRGVAEFYYIMSGEGNVAITTRGQAEADRRKTRPTVEQPRNHRRLTIMRVGQEYVS